MARGGAKAATGGAVEGPWALPEGWRWVPLGSLGEFWNGAAFKPSDWGDVGTPIIRIQNLNDPSKRMHRTERVVDARLKVKAGDLLVSWSATLDAFVWKREDAWLNQHIFRVVPHEKVVDRKYILFLLKNEIENLKKTEHLHGSTMMHINRGPFLAHLVPLPPMATQKLVAQSISDLLDEVDDGEAALARARGDLGTWRKALLKAAVTGELTADWRAANPPGETGGALLARILAERRARWLAEPRNRGKKYVEIKPLDCSDLSELPESWVWMTVDLLAQITGGVTKNAKRDAHPHRLPYLRVGNVYDGRLNLERIESIGLSESEVSRVLLQKGDLLIVEGNGSIDQIGRSAIWTGEIDPCVHQNHLIKLRAYESINSSIIQIWLQSLGGRKELEEKASSTSGLHTLSISKIEAIRCPLPPPDEAAEIVVRLRSALTSHLDPV